jgi:hypothetical protein
MMSPDVLQNLVARGLLLDLADRGIELFVRRGNLASVQAAALTEADRTALRQHKPDLLMLVLMCTDQTLDRLLDLRAGRLLEARHHEDGRCHSCNGELPAGRRHGRCGWCAVAARLYAGGPVPASLLHLFPPDIAGPQHVPLPQGGALPFDLAVPA